MRSAVRRAYLPSRYYFMNDNQFPDLHNSLVKPFVLAMSNCNVRQQYRQNVLFLYLLQT